MRTKLKPNKSETLFKSISHVASSFQSQFNNLTIDEQNQDDGEGTYLTSSHRPETTKVLKRTLTAISGKPKFGENFALSNKNRIQTASILTSQARAKSPYQSSNSLPDAGKHFLMQSIIVTKGLSEYGEKIQLIEQEDIRNIGDLFSHASNKGRRDRDLGEKIVPSNQKLIPREQTRAELDRKQMNIVNLNQCIFKYLEIKLKGQNKPLFLFFNYTDTKAKFKMFLSRHTYTPNIFNCEEVFNKKVVLKYNEPGDTIQFHSDTVYLAIFASQQTTIHMKVQFGSGFHTREYRPLQKAVQEIHHLSKAALQKEIQMIKESKKQQILNSDGGDLISKNMEMEQHIPQVREQQLTLKRAQSAGRMIGILTKKREIDHDRKEQTLQKFEHGQKVKILREIFKYYNKIEDTLASQQRQWVTWISVILLSRRIKTAYHIRLKQMVDESYKARVRNKIRRDIKSFITCKADNIQKRTLVDQSAYIHIYIEILLHSAIQMFARATKKRAKKQAAMAVENFMKSYGMIGELVEKMHAIKRFALKLQDQYSGFKKRSKCYTDRIVKLWNLKWRGMFQAIQQQEYEIHKLTQGGKATTEDEYHKTPFVDSKSQNLIVLAYFNELKVNFHTQAILKFKKLGEAQQQQQQQLQVVKKAVGVVQQLGGLKAIRLFIPVNDAVIQDLVHRYMLEKKLLKTPNK